MTTISSGLNKVEDGLPGINRTMLGQISGLLKHLTRAEFDAIVTAERGRISSNSMGVFKDLERLYIIGEEGYRVWTLGTGGTDAANAAASHAKTVVLPNGKKITLTADANTLTSTSGLPTNGIDGNVAVDWSTGVFYTRSSGVWAITQNTAPAYVKIGDYSTGQITTLNANIAAGTVTYPVGAAVWNTTVGAIWPLSGLGTSAVFAALGSGSGSSPVAVTGVSGLGEILTAVIATGWIYTSLQWKRNVDGVVSDISGATSLTYTQVSLDVTSGTRVYPVVFGLAYAAPGVAAAVAPLTISGTPSASGNVNTAYTFTPVVTGGYGTKTFSLTGGPLPPGLSLNTSTGAVSGTPTTIGTSVGISIRVTDSLASTADLAPFSINIAAALIPQGSMYLDGNSVLLDGNYIILA